MSPTGVVVVLAVLLLISVTINLLLAAHWMYTLRGKRGTKSRGEGPGNQTEGAYEDVDNVRPHYTNCAQPHYTAIPLKRNESYSKIGSQNLSITTNSAF